MIQFLKTIKSPNRHSLQITDLKLKASDFETRHSREHVPRIDMLLGHFLLVHEASFSPISDDDSLAR
jgi:hypothetical protein